MKLRVRFAGPWLALVALAACGGNGGPPDARVIDGAPPGGTFSLTWTIHDGATALTCADLANPTVAVSIVEEGAGFGVSDVFSCSSTTGTSRALAPGTYNLTIELTGATGALGPAIVRQGVVVVTSADTPLDPIDFMVMAQGGLGFRIAAAGQPSNCAGAGIDGMLLQMRDGTNTCVPATFTIAAGATAPASTYSDDCATAVVGPCIEQDQQVTVTGLRSGPARLVITGQTAGLACWSGVHFLTVPTMSTVRDYGALTLPRNNAVCPLADAMM